jgi:uncharacterized alkaline shock family protein YloU
MEKRNIQGSVTAMANEEKEQIQRAPGTTTIAPGVLVTIAQLAALSVPGVSAMAPIPGGVNRLFHRGSGEGVRIEVEDNTVSVDLHLVLECDTNVRQVSRSVQMEVARAIENMVGMEIQHINVHIEDIDYGPECD